MVRLQSSVVSGQLFVTLFCGSAGHAGRNCHFPRRPAGGKPVPRWPDHRNGGVGSSGAVLRPAW